MLRYGQMRMRLVVSLLGSLTVASLLAVPANAAMSTPKFVNPVERLASYDPQNTCSPTAKPGTSRFAAAVVRSYPGTGTFGIVRACNLGGRSEHKEGRAWDWRVNAADPKQRAQAHDMLRWLFASDALGNRAANARRVGLMYLIHDRKIWSAYGPGTGWRPYSGPNPHTDHMHMSFSRAGAKAQTSWYAVVGPGPVTGTPRVLPVPPRTAPLPAPKRNPTPASPDQLPSTNHDAEGGWHPSDSHKREQDRGDTRRTRDQRDAIDRAEEQHDPRTWGRPGTGAKDRNSRGDRSGHGW